MLKGHEAWKALGRKKAGVMNKTEALYAEQLDRLKCSGDVLWWEFEGAKFKLANLTFYTPDFIVHHSDMVVRLHEVKGSFIQDKALTKVKIAAEKYPFEFLVMQYAKKTWTCIAKY